MKRRDFIAGTAAGTAAAVVAGSGLAQAQKAPAMMRKRIEIAIVTTWPRDFPGLGTGAQRFAKRLQDMSDGRIKVSYFAAGERVGAFDSFDAVASGNAQAYHAADYYWKGKHPGWAYFTSVPFGLTYTEMNAWIRFGGGQQLWDELAGEFGIKGLMCGNTGVQMGGWFRKEINSADDLKGLKMRIPGLGGEVFSRAGGVAVTMPGSEIFTSVQTGVIDATEWIGPYNDLAFGLQEVARYYYYPGWHEPGATLEAIVNAEALAALPADLRAMLEVACTAVNQEVLDEFTARNATALKVLSEEHGIEVRRLPDDVLQRFAALSAEVLAEEAAGDELSGRILDSYMSFLAEVREYHAISEQAYVNARAEIDWFATPPEFAQ